MDVHFLLRSLLYEKRPLPSGCGLFKTCRRRLFKLRQSELHLHTHALVNLPLLQNSQGVVRNPVQHQASREEEEHDGERHRHDPHQPRL